jgi:hypothetical protein
MARFQTAWNQEFEVLREAQEDRLHMTASVLCVDKCVGHNLWTNIFLPHEQSCMEACLHKYAQANLIANINMQKFTMNEEQALKEAKKRR